MLNTAEIALLIEELGPWLGSVVQKVQQSRPEELTIGLRRPGATAWLSLRLQRGNPHFCLITARTPALEKATAFTMALRKYLAGGRLTSITQPAGERIARFSFQRTQGDVILIAELIPPGGNLILVTGEEKILARLFNDDRNGRAGRPYIAPPAVTGQKTPTVRAWEGESFHAFLAGQDDVRDEKAAAPDGKAERKRATLHEKLEADWKRAGDPQYWRNLGEPLLNHPLSAQNGLAEIVVGTETIPLDPSLTVRENGEAYYRKARRAESARQHITERRLALESTPLAVATQSPTARAKPVRVSTFPKGHIFMLPGGTVIAAGRSAEENDRVTFGWARGEDVWMHARGAHGSHVAVRLAPGDEAEAALDDAARIALHYSGRRGEPAGDVQVALKKHVQRINGAPGKVNLRLEENRRVAVNEADMQRLESCRVKKG